MKLFKFLLPVLSCIFFISCFEINEEVKIQENGSGRFSTEIDLSQLAEVIQSAAANPFESDSTFKKDDLEKKVDTTFSIRSIIDTSKTLSPEQKLLMKDGLIKIKMNLPGKEFKINMQYPFDNLEKLQQLNNAITSGSLGVTSIMKNVMGENKADVGAAVPDVDQMMSLYDYSIKDGLIKKTLNQERLKKFQRSVQYQQLKQTADLGAEMLYNSVYNLPRPVKKIDDKKAKVSDDKKTIIIRQNLLDVFSTPEKLVFTIEY